MCLNEVVIDLTDDVHDGVANSDYFNRHESSRPEMSSRQQQSKVPFAPLGANGADTRLKEPRSMDHRLPRSILPINYAVEISPDRASHTFMGSVVVQAAVVTETNELRCNSLELDITSASIDGEEVDVVLDVENEQLVVDLGGPRSPGPIEFTASFSGELNDALKGFYRSTFTDDDGVEHVIATTQFQSTDARRAFPCWDEPDMKATFDVTLVVDPEETAVSNGAEVERTDRDGGKVAVRFAQTMKMSTYLVAFVVGPLEVSEPAMAGSTPVRIVHRPGKSHLTTFALDVAVHALAYFEEYYGIAYPADKLDMIALPDFAMGAMENLGCVTYREILLLVDPESATQPELQNVADVINHELAHMWFGDLVTMGWWNGIWLNEAFATFMEMKATDAYRPKWQRWTSFGISRSAAFDVDSLAATRPIEFPVVSPADAEAMFDLLTYEKGAGVVRMLEQWVGEEPFREGIRHYLTTHAYGNTDTNDLWEALEHVSDQPITAAMESWIFQGGYPVIQIDPDGLCQRRFTYEQVESDALWHVPVQLRRGDGVVQTVLISEMEISLDDPDSIESFNHQGSGFYRVKLPTQRLSALGSSGVSHLPAVERFGIIDDTWSLTLAGETELVDLFALLSGYRDEDDISVWQRVLGAAGFVNHVAKEADRAHLGAHVAELITPTMGRLGDAPSSGESMRTSQLRGALFAAAGNLTPEGSDLRLSTTARAHELLNDDGADAELYAAAIKVVAANGSAADFDRFRAGFEDAESPQAEMRNLYALPSFPGAEQIETVTTMAIDGSIRTQNAPFVLAQALMNRAHGPAVWQRIEGDWSAINDAFPSNTIVRMLTGVRWLTDDDSARAVQNFFAGRELPQGQKQLDQHLERQRVNAAFRSRVHDQLGAVLSA